MPSCLLNSEERYHRCPRGQNGAKRDKQSGDNGKESRNPNPDQRSNPLCHLRRVFEAINDDHGEHYGRLCQEHGH